MKHLIKLGYYCVRSYASKGIFDFVAIPPTTSTVLDWKDRPVMVQCKTRGYLPPKERSELKNAANRYNGVVLLAYVGKKHEIKFEEIQK